jgi:hypothetical protein
VGQGRSYVYLGKQPRVDYAKWCEGIARGRSYVSDGYAHAFDFLVNGKTSGEELKLSAPAKVTVRANVAFSPETPLEPIYGGVIPVGGPRHVGDTVNMRATLALDPVYQRGERQVELVVNGRVVASVACAGDADDLFFDAPRARAYVSGGAGEISVIERRGPDDYAAVAAVTTAPGARTSFFVADTSRLYLAVPHRGTQRAELRVFEAVAHK